MSIKAENLFFNNNRAFKTTAEDFPILFTLTGPSGLEKKDYDTGAIKTHEDGRTLYSTTGEILSLTKDGEIMNARNIYLSTLEPLTAKPSLMNRVFYKAEGEVWVKKYVIGGNLGTSITVTRLVPLTAEEMEALNRFEQGETTTEKKTETEPASKPVTSGLTSLKNNNN